MSEADYERAKADWYAATIAYMEGDPARRDHLDVDIARLARGVDAPVFVVEGGADAVIAPPQGEELAAMLDAAGNPDVTWRRYQSVNHFFTPQPDGTGAPGAVTDFGLDRRVKRDARDWVLDRLP
ncbi:MAG: hypothetical protein ABL308_10260 [Oceanicaulis sp.]